MNTGGTHLYRRVRIAGSLIIAGLAVEFVSLLRIHPLAFLAFMFIGGSFLLAGIGFYLYSIAGAPPTDGDHLT
jgi:hypothetical protein